MCYLLCWTWSHTSPSGPMPLFQSSGGEAFNVTLEKMTLVGILTVYRWWDVICLGWIIISNRIMSTIVWGILSNNDLMTDRCCSGTHLLDWKYKFCCNKHLIQHNMYRASYCSLSLLWRMSHGCYKWSTRWRRGNRNNSIPYKQSIRIEMRV